MTDTEQEKPCTRCHEVRPLDEFHRKATGKHGRAAHCRECERERNRAYRAANPEYRIAYHAAHPEAAWIAAYRRRARAYGFTPYIEEFTKDDVIARHGGRCVHCPGGEFVHLDHYPMSVAEGGPHTLWNVRPSCAHCNLAAPKYMADRLEVVA